MADKDLVDYFIRETNSRFEKVDEKLDHLLQFKWQLIGASIVVTLLINVAFLVYQGGS